jgi:hypothetical protein
MRNLVAMVVTAALLVVCTAAEKPEEPQAYEMPAAEFLKRFGVALGSMPRAPQASLVAIPPYPFKMRERRIDGWSAYVVRIDAKGKVKSAELVGYSRKDFGNGSEPLLRWRFGSTAKEGAYLVLLRYTLTPTGATVDQIL